MKVVFLGTGVPSIEKGALRAGASEVVLIDDDAILFDCGRWVSMRLTESDINIGNLKYLFLTHQHRDHTVDLPACLSMIPRYRRLTPLHVYGPKGTVDFLSKMKDAFRMHLPVDRAWGRMEIKDVDAGLICEGKSWKITAAHVMHTSAGAGRDASVMRPGELSLAYRIDSDEGSVVISGDVTALPRSNKSKSYSSNVDLTKLAKGARVYIMDADVAHTTPEALGRAAEEAGVKIVVLTHIHNPGNANIVQPNYDDFVNMISEFFNGKIVIADDLKILEI